MGIFSKVSNVAKKSLGYAKYGLGFLSGSGAIAAGAGALGGLLSSAYQFRHQRKLMDSQYDLNQLSLRESPSAYREGLEAAGYNPLLAINNGVPAPTSGLSSVSAPNIDPVSAVMAKKQMDLLKSQTEKVKAEASIAHAEASSAMSQAALNKEYADMELEALKDEDYKVLVNGKDTNPTRSEYRQMIRNGIQRRRYTNSREHAITEDAVNAIHGGTSAFEQMSLGRRNWRLGTRGY